MRRTLRRFAVASTWSAGVAVALVIGAFLVPATAQDAAIVAPNGSTPQPGDPVSASGNPSLGRSIPKENLHFLLEFSGLDDHDAAWRNSAAYRILNDTSTGEMFRDLVVQAVEMATAENPDRRLGGGDIVRLIEHIARNGAAMSVNGTIEGHPGAAHPLLVIRKAATKEAMPLFGKMLAGMMGEAAKKAKPTDRGRRRVIEYTDTASGESRAWWIEGGDLFLTDAKDVDLILGVLDGTIPNAEDHPLRTELAGAGFEPVGWMLMELAKLPQDEMPAEARASIAALGLNNLQRLDLRWGFEGPAMLTGVRVVAPQPRSGLLSVMDVPSFSPSDLPPIPSSIDNFMVLGIDLPATFDRLANVIISQQPGARAEIEAFEQRVKDTLKRDLRTEILGPLGPRAVVYFPQALGSTNRLASVVSSLSVQVPKAVVVVEVKDPAVFTRSLDELMIQANRLLADQASTLMAGLAPAATSPQPGGPAPKAEKPDPPQFRLISSTPKTYLLRLPPQLGAVMNLSVTVAMGKKHVVIATAPDLARQALALEDSSEGRWTPSGSLASTFAQLPGQVTMLQVSDTSETLPESLASLPATLETVTTTIAAARKAADDARLAAESGQPAPGGPGGGSGAMAAMDPRRAQRSMGAAMGYGGGSGPPPGAVMAGSSGAMMAGANIPPTGGGGTMAGLDLPPGGSGGMRGGPPGQPGAPGPGAPTTIRLNPANAPSADAIRGMLFPGSMAISVNDQGIDLVSRTAFPNLVSEANGISVALLLPAIQAARDAAQKAAESAGSGIGVPPIGAPGGSGAGLPDLGRSRDEP